jgi:CRP/FNR family nitrogen fixation transcriptional regulator
MANEQDEKEKNSRLVFGDLPDAKVSPTKFNFLKDAVIFRQAEPAHYVYQVIEGAVRSHKLLSGGRRQIGAFPLPGDVFGYENGEVHRFTAEAIVDSSVRHVKRRTLEREAKNDAVLVGTLLKITTDNLQHVENHLLLLGRQSAPERVAAFLLEMHDRLKSAGAMAMPMTRRDIGDYLGLSLETVSRVLSRYQRQGYLKLAGPMQREITVTDPVGLAEVDCAPL